MVVGVSLLMMMVVAVLLLAVVESAVLDGSLGWALSLMPTCFRVS